MSEYLWTIAWLVTGGAAVYVARVFWVLYTDTHLNIHPGWTWEYPHASRDNSDQPRTWLVKVYLMAHSHQAGQRWIFMFRYSWAGGRSDATMSGYWWKHRRFGYRTYGDSSPKYDSWNDGGWYWPWQKRRWPCGLA